MTASPGPRPSPTAFRARVLAAVRSIAAGRVATYGDIAAVAGRPHAWRGVGTIMRTCTDPSVPCHRVVGADRALRGAGRDLNRARALLIAEGVVVAGKRIRNFNFHRVRAGRRYL